MNARARGFVLLPVTLAMLLIGMLAWQSNREGGHAIEGGSDLQAAAVARYAAEAGLAYASQQLNALNCGAAPASYTLSLSGSGSASVAVSVAGTASKVLTSTGSYNGATQTLSRTVPVYATTLYLLTVMRPKPTVHDTVYDTLVAADGATYNFGQDSQLIVDNSSAGTTNALLRFDLTASTLAATAKLVSAQLTLTRAPYNIFSISQLLAKLAVRKLTRAWTEGSGQGISGSDPIVTTSSNQSAGATWRQASNGVAWTAAPGGQTSYGPGDVDLPVDSQIAGQILLVLGSTPQAISWDVTGPASEWLADPASNYGLLVEAEAGMQKLPFWSSEAGTASYRPTLTLAYQLPCGQSAGPLLTVAFGSGTITNLQSTTLTYTIGNSTASSVGSVNLSNALPAGLAVSGTPSSSCGGTATTSVSGSTTTVTLSNAVLPAASGGVPGSCTLTATVHSATAGTYAVSTTPGTVTTSAGSNTNLSGDTLVVTGMPPYVQLSFPVAGNPWGGQLLQATLFNPASTAATMTAPATITFLPGIGVMPGSDSCGGSVTAAPITGSSPLTYQGSLSGASIPSASGGTPGSCSATALFTPLPPGSYHEAFPSGGLVTSLGTSTLSADAWLMPPSQDTSVSNGGGLSNTNWGAATALPVYENGGPYRALMSFDLSAIPAGTVLYSARLRVFASIGSPTGSTITLNAYTVPRAWAEGTGTGTGTASSGATWTHEDAGKPPTWSPAGVIQVSSSTPVAGSVVTASGWVEMDVTAAVQAWINGSTNNGFLLANSNSAKNVDTLSLASRETLNAPQLMLSY